MKLLIIPVFLIGISAKAQFHQTAFVAPVTNNQSFVQSDLPVEKIKISTPMRWKFDRNKFLTGSLMFISGLAKGFNEALQYKYNGFEDIFPHADDQWFYPTFSYTNKYKNHDPEQGARFPLSTSVLVMFTDQYHLNNFIQKTALTAAIVLKIGNGKKPFKQYLMDVIYYTACYQMGFHAVYQPIAARN